MTNYALEIKEQNIQAHIDIEHDIQEKKNGLFTFTIRVNNSNIVDYNVTEYIDVKRKYGIIKALIIEEVTITQPESPSNNSQRSTPDPIRTDNI